LTRLLEQKLEEPTWLYLIEVCFSGELSDGGQGSSWELPSVYKAAYIAIVGEHASIGLIPQRALHYSRHQRAMFSSPLRSLIGHDAFSLVMDVTWPCNVSFADGAWKIMIWGKAVSFQGRGRLSSSPIGMASRSRRVIWVPCMVSFKRLGPTLSRRLSRAGSLSIWRLGVAS
jgi:hypothetical protein